MFSRSLAAPTRAPGGAPTAFIPIPRWPPTTIPRSRSRSLLLPPAAGDAGGGADALAAIRQSPTAPARVAAGSATISASEPERERVRVALAC